MTTEILKLEPERTEDDLSSLYSTVSDVLKDIKKEGDRAVSKYTLKFDKLQLEKFLLSKDEIENKIKNLNPKTKDLIDENITRITKFARFQLSMYRDMQIEVDGNETVLGQKIVPISSAGIYVPAGRFPLLSSALMGIIPAKVAGVKRIVAMTPPGENRPDIGVLYGIYKAGATEVYTIGGIQAIGALAYGTETIKPVDKIFGPGNKYVNEAKRQVFGEVGIDLLAGPSEVLIIADETANIDLVAYDLLAQAEHDIAARSCLVTTSREMALKLKNEMPKYIETLATREILRVSWKEKGSIIYCNNFDEALEYANNYAPEHLELHVSIKHREEAFEKLDNFGSLFMNQNTPVVFSDKLIGTNHTLPTNRASRYTGGLNVGAFLKVLTFQEVLGEVALKELSRRAFEQSKLEGLSGHAKSAELRAKLFKDIRINSGEE
ncbi:histidinol dehydrogenase [Oxyplasma meridianum]|uniref:Histidinol dehydrogenase n=1 Tax=Oxyplasma meridianum TaxID=3073602 RepID=A0AAX4NGN4_9ARCH